LPMPISPLTNRVRNHANGSRNSVVGTTTQPGDPGWRGLGPVGKKVNAGGWREAGFPAVVTRRLELSGAGCHRQGSTPIRLKWLVTPRTGAGPRRVRLAGVGFHRGAVYRLMQLSKLRARQASWVTFTQSACLMVYQGGEGALGLISLPFGGEPDFKSGASVTVKPSERPR
jgi:hypothetical protein